MRIERAEDGNGMVLTNSNGETMRVSVMEFWEICKSSDRMNVKDEVINFLDDIGDIAGTEADKILEHLDLINEIIDETIRIRTNNENSDQIYDAAKKKVREFFERPISLMVNEYADDNEKELIKSICFQVAYEELERYLDINDYRTVEEFFETHDNEDVLEAFNYIKDRDKIVCEELIFSNKNIETDKFTERTNAQLSFDIIDGQQFVCVDLCYDNKASLPLCDVASLFQQPATSENVLLGQSILNQLAEKYHIPAYDESSLTIIRYPVKVELVNIGEGFCGEYNPHDPDDMNLLRFYVSVFDDGEWVEKDDASYCTNIPAEATDGEKKAALEILLDRFYDALSQDISVNVKKMGEEMSYISLADVGTYFNAETEKIYEIRRADMENLKEYHIWKHANEDVWEKCSELFGWGSDALVMVDVKKVREFDYKGEHFKVFADPNCKDRFSKEEFFEPTGKVGKVVYHRFTNNDFVNVVMQEDFEKKSSLSEQIQSASSRNTESGSRSAENTNQLGRAH